MSFGGSFITDFGNTLIDETFKSLALVAKGTITTDTVHPLGSSKIFTFTGTHPLVALQSDTTCGIDTQGLSGSTWQLEVWAAGGIGSTITYYLFDDVPNTAPTGYGMIVKNSSGQIVFDSTHKYLRVVAFIHAAITYTLTSGRTYAAIFANGKGHISSIHGSPFTTKWWLYGVSIVSNVITVTDNNWQTGSTDTDETYVPGLDMLLVDVTNY